LLLARFAFLLLTFKTLCRLRREQKKPARIVTHHVIHLTQTKLNGLFMIKLTSHSARRRAIPLSGPIASTCRRLLFCGAGPQRSLVSLALRG